MNIIELVNLRELLKKYISIVEDQDQARTDAENVLDEVCQIIRHLIQH